MGKRIGRPTKAPQPGKKVSLGLKVTADIKNRLDAAARASGRTQSQEAERRLEGSFEHENRLTQISDSLERMMAMMGVTAKRVKRKGPKK
jgi:predicted transcriptional regulator